MNANEIWKFPYDCIRVDYVKEIIKQKYGLSENKFDVVKIGRRIWLYAVNKNNDLERHLIFIGALSTVKDSELLKNYLIENIEKGLKKFGYL